jgi:hypothetical protein
MIDKIVGAVIISASIIAASALAVEGIRSFVEMRRTKRIAESQERMQRAEMTQRIFESNTFRMYEEERQGRIAAETKVRVYKDQLKRARELMAKFNLHK